MLNQAAVEQATIQEERREAPKSESTLEIVISPMTVADVAQKVQKPVSDVILTLLKQGIAATKNQLLPEKTVATLANQYGLKLFKNSCKATRTEEGYGCPGGNVGRAIAGCGGYWAR